MSSARFILIVIGFILLTAACGPQPVPVRTAAPSATITPTPILAPVPSAEAATPTKHSASPAIENGVKFLKSQYNPALGLLREAPNTAPHTYWLCNDNALAAYVLDQLGETELSSRLHATLLRYKAETNGLIEMIWGIHVDFPPYVATNQTIDQTGNDEIREEQHSGGSRFEDWREYANLTFLEALDNHWQGRSDEALLVFRNGMGLFDGTGFKDKAYNGQYETYKVALALYASSILQTPLPQQDSLCTILLSMQNSEGGFYTHYTQPGQPSGDTNTETTSLALLALMNACPYSN